MKANLKSLSVAPVGGADSPRQLRLFDAHNHLQDERLRPWQEMASRTAVESGVIRMVVNGSCEGDWADVLRLAQANSMIVPSFGYHPWYVGERSARWQSNLVQQLDAIPSGVGEIGLDRWIKEHDSAQQEEAFIWQLNLAAKRGLPVSIHCLQAWGRLVEILRAETRPACGFLLHSFGGPKELIPALADLGAFFSLPGYFAHERKVRQRETFRYVPSDRLLIETDAPDQSLPDERNAYPLIEAKTGRALNHPSNLIQVYRFAAELLGESLVGLAERVERNFHQLFGGITRPTR